MRKHPRRNLSSKNNQYLIFSKKQKSTQEIIQIMHLKYNDIYLELYRIGLSKNLADTLIDYIVHFISQQHSSLEPAQIYDRFKNQIPFNLVTRRFNIQKEEIDRMLFNIIEVVLNIIND